MTVDPSAPADTTMMRIVHDALRRDLRRAHSALTADPAPDARQRAAIADQLRWMAAFLEAHHRSEDLGLFPPVRERAPEARALLDDLQADHVAVAAAIARVERAADDAPPAGGTDPLADAVAGLEAVLLPHLRREEDEAMPVVSRVLSHGEWRAIEQAHNLAGKSAAQLGREGHWLIDGATSGDRATVLALVPPVQRFVLLHGFGPAYRRRARACWQPHRRIPHHGGAAVEVDVDVAAVWEVVRDPTGVGEWSHECVDGTWLGGATEAVPGARFRGRNRQGLLRWGRVCEVLVAEPHRIVWRTVPSRRYPDSTVWTIRLAAVDEGRTRIEQTYEVVTTTILEPIYATMIPAHRDRTEQLRADLRRIGAVAAARSRTERVTS